MVLLTPQQKVKQFINNMDKIQRFHIQDVMLATKLPYNTTKSILSRMAIREEIQHSVLEKGLYWNGSDPTITNNGYAKRLLRLEEDKQKRLLEGSWSTKDGCNFKSKPKPIAPINPFLTTTGWVCPQCKVGVSPSQTFCPKCKP